ncbi:MAG: hypothetical protein K0R55_2724 [Sporomusa sp.]|jgi:hypothetical protein|nr:hypothetical protein [Sporomusa sp.]
MKKFGYTFLLTAFMVAAAASSCFAENAPDDFVDSAKPVVLDRDYPELGIKIHSWITGTGSDTIAHTQTIDLATGTVIKQKDTKCGYTDSVEFTDSNS